MIKLDKNQVGRERVYFASWLQYKVPSQSRNLEAGPDAETTEELYSPSLGQFVFLNNPEPPAGDGTTHSGVSYP